MSDTGGQAGFGVQDHLVDIIRAPDPEELKPDNDNEPEPEKPEAS